METNYTSKQICERIPQVIPSWNYQEQQLQRSFFFPSFLNGVRFVGQVAKLADQKKHHPTIVINFTTVHLSLSTHDTKGITEKDFVLAREIDTLLKK